MNDHQCYEFISLSRELQREQADAYRLFEQFIEKPESKTEAATIYSKLLTVIKLRESISEVLRD